MVLDETFVCKTGDKSRLVLENTQELVGFTVELPGAGHDEHCVLLSEEDCYKLINSILSYWENYNSGESDE